MSMTYVHTETLGRDVAELVEEWNFENFNSTKLVQPGVYDDSFTLGDLNYILEHISVY